MPIFLCLPRPMFIHFFPPIHLFLCLPRLMFYLFLFLPALHLFACLGWCFSFVPSTYFFAFLGWCFIYFFASQPYISFLPSPHFFASLGQCFSYFFLSQPNISLLAQLYVLSISLSHTTISLLPALYSGHYFQGPGCISKYGNAHFFQIRNGNKIAEKFLGKKGIMFTVGDDDEDVQKVEEINDTSSNGLSGGWSHDQFPKIVEKQSCSPTL